VEYPGNNRPITPEETEYIRDRVYGGATQSAIAAELNRGQGTISKIVARLRREAAKEAAANLDLDVEKMRALGQLEWAIAAARQSYEASCRPRRTSRGRYGPPDSQGASVLLPEGDDGDADGDRPGDPRFLAMALKAIESKRRLLGLSPEHEAARKAEKARAAHLARDPISRARAGLPPLPTPLSPPAETPEGPGHPSLYLPDEDDLDDGESLEDTLVELLEERGEDVPIETWERVLPRLSTACWDRLLPKMPPVFRQELRQAACADLRRQIHEEKVRRGWVTPDPVPTDAG
jgi:hypothetical protein